MLLEGMAAGNKRRGQWVDRQGSNTHWKTYIWDLLIKNIYNSIWVTTPGRPSCPWSLAGFCLLDFTHFFLGLGYRDWFLPWSFSDSSPGTFGWAVPCSNAVSGSPLRVFSFALWISVPFTHPCRTCERGEILHGSVTASTQPTYVVGRATNLNTFSTSLYWCWNWNLYWCWNGNHEVQIHFKTAKKDMKYSAQNAMKMVRGAYIMAKPAAPYIQEWKSICTKAKPLLRHSMLHHSRRRVKFNIRKTGSFQDPLSRQINEGVRINNSTSDPGYLMNSKAEFHQGQIPIIVITSGLN